MADVERLNCKWCNASEAVDGDCQHCRESRCRAPKLNDRSWTIKVTPNRWFSPITQSSVIFTQPNQCCNLADMPVCSGAFLNPCDGLYESSGLLRWSAQSLQVLSVSQRYSRGLGVGLTCQCLEAIDDCTIRYRYDRKCAQGYRFAADIQSIKLYISRTYPRYSCTPVQCQYRLALVVEGRVALAFATQVTDARFDSLVADNGYCGASSPTPPCQTPGSGTYPVPIPPPFDASLISLSPVTWRRVYRRTLDTLEMPITFSAANTTTSACGPQCGETATESIPTLSTTLPSLTCIAWDAVIDCSNCWQENTSCTTRVDCRTTCDPSNTLFWQPETFGSVNTEELRTSSGPTTVNTLPTFTFPDSFDVEIS